MATHRADVHHGAASAGGAVLRSGVEPPPGPASPAEVASEEVRHQLQKVLASPSFRNSRRSIQFLSFVVEKALAGSSSEIKERVIGIEVFDRPPDYDLAADPIVRGAAVELRKRLAQYYAEPDHSQELRLELPLRTYAPIFYWPPPAHNDKEPPASSERHTLEKTFAPGNDPHPSRAAEKTPGQSRGRGAILTGCVLGLAIIAAIWSTHSTGVQSAKSALDAFWAPVMDGGDSITVCVGDLNYLFKAPRFSSTVHLPQSADNLLNPNAGAALLRVGSILGSKGKRSSLRLADLTQLNDLRQQPVIFIGGMNNPWTQRILAGLRFRMMTKPDGADGSYQLVTDEKNPSQTSWRVDINAPLSSITRDYSLVTRINDPLTGEPVVILCGLGPYGTAAASEFVSNPDDFSQFSSRAPKGWQNHNIQIVLETRVVDGRVSVPRVVAQQSF